MHKKVSVQQNHEYVIDEAVEINTLACDEVDKTVSLGKISTIHLDYLMNVSGKT